MTVTENLYPGSIAGVPATLTQPSATYRRSVIIVLSGLVVFMLFYLALVAASGFALYEAVTYPMGEVNRWTIMLKLGSVGMAGMLCFFLVKGLFKRHRMEDEMQVELTETEHPEFFGFIRRLCAETRAPFPHRVFLSPEVNAAVAYNSSLLNLLFPVKKNLLIGLGLVNCLNLAEFKAVLAHEFGHFSQSSMRLGSYVYMANRIIADMVYNRDAFDDMLAGWRRQDLRVAIFGHLLSGIVWILRKILELAYRGINFVQSALSRQMEFHADLVAVSVTGSDSLIHALRRLSFGNDSLMQALEDLKHASHHRLYTRDLFYHQTKAEEHLRRLSGDPGLGAPPALPPDPQQKVRVFEPGEEGIPSMWASHPSSSDREENAKRIYFRSPVDERPPWLLFQNPERLRQTLTTRFYELVLELPRGATYADPEEVQRFIDEEHAEVTQDPRYLGLYDGRWVRPGDVESLVAAVSSSPWTAEAVDVVFRRLYHQEFKEWLNGHRDRVGEFSLLRALEDGELKLKGKSFPFRNSDHQLPDVPRLLETVNGDLKRDAEWLEQFDREVFQAHYARALAAGVGVDVELLERYRFETIIQDILQSMNSQRAMLEAVLGGLGQQTKMEEAKLKELIGYLRQARAAVAGALQMAQPVIIPPLRNMNPGQGLATFLTERTVVTDLSADAGSLSGEWIGALMEQIVEIQERARRLDSKNLGALLALQERIAAGWLAANPAPAEL